MLISSAAHFVVCACGGHGKLVAANGEGSVELCSKEEARLVLDEGVKTGKISNIEVGEALRQINASSLAPREEDAKPIAHLGAGIINLLDTVERMLSAELGADEDESSPPANRPN